MYYNHVYFLPFILIKPTLDKVRLTMSGTHLKDV